MELIIDSSQGHIKSQTCGMFSVKQVHKYFLCMSEVWNSKQNESLISAGVVILTYNGTRFVQTDQNIEILVLFNYINIYRDSRIT